MMTPVVAAHHRPSRNLMAERIKAAELAVTLHAAKSGKPHADTVTADADVIFKWLTAAIHWQLHPGPVFNQDTGRSDYRKLGTPVQIHDDEGVVYTLSALDSRGQEVLDDPNTDTDNAEWTLDGTDLLTVTVDASNRQATVLAQGPTGSGVMTVTIPTANGPLVVTEAIDVVAGDIATVSLSPGTPFKQSEGPSA